MARWSEYLAVAMMMCVTCALAQKALYEFEVASLSERDFLRAQKRASVVKNAELSNKLNPLFSVARAKQAAAASEELVCGRDHHYFASAGEREQFEVAWATWNATAVEERAGEPRPELRTFRYFKSPDDEDKQERNARLLRVVTDRDAYPTVGAWVEEQWVSGGLLLGVRRPVRLEAAFLDDVPLELFDLILCTRGSGEAVVRLFERSKAYGAEISSQNVGVFDFSDTCEEKQWMRDVSYFITAAFCPELQEKYAAKMYWTPRGYEKFTPWAPETLPPASERGYLYVMQASLGSGTGAEAIFAESKLPGEFTVYELEETQELVKDQVGRILYMREAAFVPCDSGQPTCIFDALQSGAIPITKEERPPTSSALGLGRVPFLRVKSWHDAPPILRYYAERPKELNRLQTRVIAWWDAYQTSLQFRVNQLLDIQFGDFQLAYYE